jgi:hypothetical protein
MLTEAEEAQTNLLGDVHRLEHVADRLGGGAVAAVGGPGRVAERVDAQLERHRPCSLVEGRTDRQITVRGSWRGAVQQGRVAGDRWRVGHGPAADDRALVPSGEVASIAGGTDGFWPSNGAGSFPSSGFRAG